MGHAAQAQGPAQLAPLGHQGDEAAVVGLELLLEDEEGEELRLGVEVDRVGVAVAREGALADGQRFTGDGDGRLRHTPRPQRTQRA